MTTALHDKSTGRPQLLIWFGVAIVWMTALTAGAVDFGDLTGFAFLSLGHGLVYGLAVWWVLSGRAEANAIVAILVVAVVCRGLALTAEPYLTTDAFRYVWDGRIQWYGWSPYGQVPASEQLVALRDDLIYPHINKKDVAVTVYPPFAQMLFMAANAISDSLLGVKVVMTIMDGIVIGAVLYWLKVLNLPAERVIVYAWHPLPIWEFVSQGHIDAGATALLMLAIVAVWTQRQSLAGGLLAMAVMTKYFPVVVMAAVWRRWDWRMPVVFIISCILLVLPYVVLGSPNVFGYLGTHLDNEGYRAGLGFHPLWLLRAYGFGDVPGWVFVAAALPLLGGLALYALFRRSADDFKAGYLVLLAAAFVWLTSPHYSWYFAWLIPLLVVHTSVSVLAMTLFSVVLYIPKVAGGVTWTELYWLTYYVPIVIGFCVYLLRSRLNPHFKI